MSWFAVNSKPNPSPLHSLGYARYGGCRFSLMTSCKPSSHSPRDLPIQLLLYLAIWFSIRFSYSGIGAESSECVKNETTPQIPLLRLKNGTVFFVINILKRPPRIGCSQVERLLKKLNALNISRTLETSNSFSLEALKARLSVFKYKLMQGRGLS